MRFVQPTFTSGQNFTLDGVTYTSEGLTSNQGQAGFFNDNVRFEYSDGSTSTANINVGGNAGGLVNFVRDENGKQWAVIRFHQDNEFTQHEPDISNKELTGLYFFNNVSGGAGISSYGAGSANDPVGGNDLIHGGTGDDTIYGQTGDDTIALEDGFGNDSIRVAKTAVIPMSMSLT